MGSLHRIASAGADGAARRMSQSIRRFVHPFHPQSRIAYGFEPELRVERLRVSRAERDAADGREVRPVPTSHDHGS